MINARLTGSFEWRQAVERRLDLMGKQNVKVGILENATFLESDYKTDLKVSEVAFFHEFGTAKTPQRSFMRSTANEKADDWLNTVKHLVENEEKTIPQALETVGNIMKNDIIDKIKKGINPPLSQQRLKERAKAGVDGDNPLYATATLAKSIQHEVVIDED